MKGITARVFFLFFLLWADYSFAVQAGLIVDFLDVGEGECTYVRTPTNEHILIDTGNVVTGNRVVRFLEGKGVHDLDALIVTHPHPDHMGGVFVLLDRFRVRQTYDNGQNVAWREKGDLYRWYGEAFRERAGYEVLEKGEVIRFGEVGIEVLSPAAAVSSDWNANSLVLRIVYQGTAFLLMGDAGVQVEEKVAASGRELHADVIKIGHHGNADASGEAFLKRVSPEYAVISVNRNNVRGYPSEEILKRLKDLGITTYLTFREGDIRFVSDGDQVRRSRDDE